MSRPLEPEAWAAAIEEQAPALPEMQGEIDLPTWQEIGDRYAALARELAG